MVPETTPYDQQTEMEMDRSIEIDEPVNNPASTITRPKAYGPPMEKVAKKVKFNRY